MDFMEMLSRGDGGEDYAFPLPEAQRDELSIVLRENARTHAFKRGDFVRWKHKCGPVVPSKRGLIVFMYWRALDHAGAADAQRIEQMSGTELSTIPDPDCLICNDQQGTTIFQVADSSMLELAL